MKIVDGIKNLFVNKEADTNNEIPTSKFNSKNSLISEKLLEYIPAMLLTSISSLLLVSVDGLIVGNLIDEDALSSVTIFTPVTFFISTFSILLSTGVANTLSTYIGQLNYDKLLHIKQSVKFLLFVTFIVTCIVQIPIVNLIISSYHLDNEMRDMVFSYGIGIMIMNPFSIISTVGIYQLQTIGKMRVVMIHAIIESLLNLIFDLLFVGVLKLGVAGAGYGTAVAGIIRAAMTFFYLSKKTDFYSSEDAKIRLEDVKDILMFGIPEAIYSLMAAFQAYAMMKIVLAAFGDFGGNIKAVCSFCYSLTSIVILSIVASARPLLGLFEGAKDIFSSKNVIKYSLFFTALFVGILVIFEEIYPTFFYILFSVDTITDDVILSLRLYALSFVITGFNSVLRLYLTTKKDSGFVSYISLFGNILLPVSAFLLYKLYSPPMLWLGALVSDSIVFVICIIRCVHFDNISLLEEFDVEEDKIYTLLKRKNINYHKLYLALKERMLNLSLKPEEAIEASRYVRAYASNKQYPERIAYRISLCLEEMVAYATKSQNKNDIKIQILIKFGKDYGIFMMFDDGECIALNKDKEFKEFTIDNYSLLKKISKSYEYQYVLNMNHSKFNF